jgi:hypothetical protein
MLTDLLHNLPDQSALDGIAFRVKQHNREPRNIVEALRAIAERMAKSRPHDAALLRKFVDAYAARVVEPAAELVAGLETVARALRHPEQRPEEAEAS